MAVYRCKNSKQSGRECDKPKQVFVEDGHDKIKWPNCNVLRLLPVDSGGGAGGGGGSGRRDRWRWMSQE